MIAAIVGAYLVLLVIPVAVCWLKGKRLWATLGAFTLWHYIPMVRLAKPHSWWARRFYDEEKLAVAAARFPINEIRRDLNEVRRNEDLEMLEGYNADEIELQDRTTRRALAKAQRRERRISRA